MRSFWRAFQPVKNQLGRISAAVVGSSKRTAALSVMLLAGSTVSVWATANTPPSNYTLSASSLVINEGQSVTLTGSFVDPDAADLHSVNINWGDGQKQKLQLPAGQLSFSVSHTYKDNKDSYPDYPKYVVSTIVADKDPVGTPNDNAPGEDHWDSEGIAIEVKNVAPTFAHDLDVTKVRGQAGKVVITGDVVDPGADTVQVFANWGQGAPQLGNGQACAMTARRSFRCEHTYPVPQIGQKSYTLKLTVRDDEGGQNVVTRTVTFP